MPGSRPLIAVVDDSPTVREFFRQVGAQMGVDVRDFAGAGQALEWLRGAAPDLLFLDIIMPDKDGLTFLQELRGLERHRGTQVVMISSKDYAQDRSVARSLGAVEYVTKPVSTVTIRDIVARYTRLPGADE